MPRSNPEGPVVRSRQERIDDVNEAIASAVLARHTLSQIRIKSLTNLDRWKEKGSWCAEYDEWETIIVNGSEEDLIAAMTDDQHRYVHLRRFAPYRGILDERLRQAIWNDVVSRNKFEPMRATHSV
ncbi:hypothetical protein [Noviherbaspirillum pedocola]|uniref:Uncharacterized protein n=1 Tax=Noviherbaspirillum pedocola TaxID=2801341 RepID=A0A934SUY6_9BURK|nr:hypothetical protein [Noviherbaspirillum pedocola]MBK4735905.1 hypothetical protein [Noviherbaspirillum pedocola]